MTPASASATARRTRYTIRTAILVVCATIAAATAIVLATRHASRYDLTATRTNELSPRTRTVLSRLEEPVAVIVSADLSRLDRRAQRRVADLLDEYAAASPHVSSSWIDTSTDAGRSAFAGTLAQLADRERELLDRHAAALKSAADAAHALPDELQALSDRLKKLAETIEAFDPRKTGTEQNAAVLRTLASQFPAAETAARQSAGNTIGGVAIPDASAALDKLLSPLSDTARAAEALAQATPVPDPSLPSPADALNVEITSLSKSIRDRAATALDSVARLPPSRTLTVARLLQAQDAVLVVSPSGITAIHFDALFPGGTSGAGESASADTRFAGEELITAALASLASNQSPVIVFVHAENAALLTPTGSPSPAARRALAHLFDRLALRRIDVAEWAVARDRQRPDPASLRGSSNRPVVWVVFPAPSRAALDPRNPAATADRSARLGKLGEAVASLITSGESVLLSVDPSDLPSVGEPDPIVAPLAPLGLRVDSTRPIVHAEVRPSGPVVWTLQTTSVPPTLDHPIARAITGLTVALPWPTPIECAPSSDSVRITPLLTIPATNNTWGESQWLSFRYAAQNPAAPLALSDPPKPDAARDSIAGPWTVAAALEQRAPSSAPSASRTQRLVVVSAPSWFDDFYTQAADTVDARTVKVFPGNAELFEASIYWLAGLDDTIATGPRAAEISRIAPLNDRQLKAWRWAIIAGLPLSILTLGVLLRLLRR
ncbi:MAG TPA: Gldg family protein [Phycisphaerales bacterium]|nr:Gldg family protein [Phycisphaerales bacterium]